MVKPQLSSSSIRRHPDNETGHARARARGARLIGERAFGLANPVGPLVDAAASHGPVSIAVLAAMALLAEWRVRFVPRIQPFVTRH
jgi:hypothetical protein